MADDFMEPTLSEKYQKQKPLIEGVVKAYFNQPGFDLHRAISRLTPTAETVSTSRQMAGVRPAAPEAEEKPATAKKAIVKPAEPAPVLGTSAAADARKKALAANEARMKLVREHLAKKKKNK